MEEEKTLPIMITIPVDRYEQLIGLETRVAVLVEFMRQNALTIAEVMKILGRGV